MQQSDLLVLILLPIFWQINPRLGACRTLNRQLTKAWWTQIMTKAMPLELFEITVLSRAP
jgi:hypothetical protein